MSTLEREPFTLAEVLANGARLLVTLALREMPYAEYLATNHWATVRGAALQRAGRRCSGCLGGILVDVHHVTRETLGDERPEDVVALCRKCQLEKKFDA